MKVAALILLVGLLACARKESAKNTYINKGSLICGNASKFLSDNTSNCLLNFDSIVTVD